MAIIVIRSKTMEKISGTYSIEWSVTEAGRSSDGKLWQRSRLVSRKRGQQIIRERGLVMSHETPDGEVYDTPNGDFKALFPEGLRSKDDERKIESIDNLV